MSLLSTKNLAVSIAGKQICHDLSLNIEAGQCWGILGKNGAGKTTLLHRLAGLGNIDNGEILFNNTPINTLSHREIAQHIGILFQHQDDPFPGTVLESTLIGRHPYLKPWQWESDEDIQQATTALQQVDLNGFESRQIQTLSGGEHQRMNIATLLVQDPQLMLLDEPTNHLDLHHQMSILKLITDKIKTENKGLMMVMHDINLAARFCDHLLMIFEDGETLHGSTDEILHRKYIEKLYQHPVNTIESPHGTVWIPT